MTHFITVQSSDEIKGNHIEWEYELRAEAIQGNEERRHSEESEV